MAKVAALLCCLALGASALQLDKKDPAFCSGVTCGELACQAPFTAKQEGSCCPVCTAPDHIIPSEKAMTKEEAGAWYDTLKTPNDKAPAHCKGAFCGATICKADEKIHHGPGACCPKCVSTGR